VWEDGAGKVGFRTGKKYDYQPVRFWTSAE